MKKCNSVNIVIQTTPCYQLLSWSVKNIIWFSVITFTTISKVNVTSLTTFQPHLTKFTKWELTIQLKIYNSISEQSFVKILNVSIGRIGLLSVYAGEALQVQGHPSENSDIARVMAGRLNTTAFFALTNLEFETPSPL